MGRQCPLGGYALYLDCLECEERVCKKMNKALKQKEYFEKIDKLMHEKGFVCYLKQNYETDNEVRCYTHTVSSQRTVKISIWIRKKKEFKFTYSNLAMCSKLETEWMSPIDNEVHFDRMYEKFEKSTKALMFAWGDY